jgi:hypothetical protein
MLTRYAPFAVLVSAIMVLVVVAPSKAPAAATSPFASFTAGGQQPLGAAPAQSPGTDANGNPTAAPGGPSGSPGVPGFASTSGPASGRVATSNTGRAAGDTSHCVKGRQFAELVTAPPCTPAFVGNNGGATWTGVTGDRIEIVYYREKDNPAVKAIEQGIGLYSDPADQQKFLPMAERFINSHYELYGRKVHIDFYQGNCSAAPPDPGCFRTDADRLVAQYHPFAVVYDNNTNTPEFYDQLSRDQTINWGGWHFADSFGQQHRPWHWDVYMAGDYQAEISGEWWCKKMAGKPARFAGDAVLQQQTRKVAVVTPDYPITREPAEHLVSIINRCAPNTAEVIAYSSDTSTATAQSTSDVAKEKKDGVTSIFWFSDPIAPVYGTTAENEQQYYPEEVLVGSGLLDYDQLAQLYNPNEWKHAFGPSDLQDPVAFSKSDAAVVWHTEGQAGDPYSSANLPWSYLSAIAYILNQAGPNLNPGTFERAAFNGPYMDFWGQAHDTSHPYIRYGPAPDAPGAYAGISDQRQVYWDPNATSPINGKAGAYVSLDHGARYRPGHWTEGEPSLPPGV